jgi:hypothetical protein
VITAARAAGVVLHDVSEAAHELKQALLCQLQGMMLQLECLLTCNEILAAKCSAQAGAVSALKTFSQVCFLLFIIMCLQERKKRTKHVVSLQHRDVALLQAALCLCACVCLLPLPAVVDLGSSIQNSPCLPSSVDLGSFKDDIAHIWCLVMRLTCYLRRQVGL